MDFSSVPTIFHITHWKAGSQWVNNVLKEYCEKSGVERFVKPKIRARHIFDAPIQSGMIYPKVYLPKHGFDAYLSFNIFSLKDYAYLKKNPTSGKALVENWINFRMKKNRIIKFIIFRDLRDSLVSWYFSMKNSHRSIDPVIEKYREELRGLSIEQGLIYLLENGFQAFANIQSSWCVEEDALWIRYEDLLEDERIGFKKIFSHCELEVDDKYFDEVISNNSFEIRSGRPRGKEDQTQHLRKGQAGDWRNYFSNEISNHFKTRFGQVLIDTGYESDDDW